MKTSKNSGSTYKKVAMVGYKKVGAAKNEEKPKRKIGKKGVIIISVSAILLVTLTLGIILSLIGGGDFDYMKSDLGEYIALSPEDYKDFALFR